MSSGGVEMGRQDARFVGVRPLENNRASEGRRACRPNQMSDVGCCIGGMCLSRLGEPFLLPGYTVGSGPFWIAVLEEQANVGAAPPPSHHRVATLPTDPCAPPGNRGGCACTEMSGILGNESR